MKKIFLLIALFHISTLFYAQNKNIETVNSLKLELKKAKQDTIKIALLNQISFLLFESDTKNSLIYGRQALQLSEKLQWKKGIGTAYNNLGLCYWSNSNFPESLKYYYKAFKINDSLKNKKELALTENGLGMVFFALEDFKKANSHFKKSLAINLELKNETEIPNNLNNIATIYYINKNFSQSLHYYKLAIEHYAKLNDTINIAYCYTNIGNTLISMKNYSGSITSFKKSIALIKNDSSLYNGYNKLGLGSVYYLQSIEKNNSKEANYLRDQSLFYLNEAILSSKKHNDLSQLIESYEYCYKIYKEKKNYKEAVVFFKMSNRIKDSIYSDENNNKIVALITQKKTEIHDKQFLLKQLKLKNEATLVYLLLTIASAVMILLGLFFWLYLSKKNTNLKLEEKNKIISNNNKQKDKFFSIIAHDLRGPFNGFLGLTEIMENDLDTMTRDDIKFAAGNMRSSATNLKRLLENLLEWSRMEQGLIPFNPQNNNLLDIVNECVATLQAAADKKEIQTLFDIPEVCNVFADTNLLQAVIRNILSNAVKFTPKGGIIIIQGKEDGKNTTIAIKDSGIGMNAKILENLFQLDVKTNRKGTDDEPSSGLGLILCKEFIEKHGGKIWVESEENKGSVFYFTFPHAIS
jgi:signal transduction histidine kinase